MSGDSKSFSKNQIFTKQIKKRVMLSSGNAHENAGSIKWRLHWGLLEGQT